MPLELNRIYNMDCLDGMRQLEDKSIDMIFTSPPFKDEDIPGNYWIFYDKFFTEAKRITSKVICIIQSATKLNHIIWQYPPKRTMVWGKGISQYSWRWNPIFVYQISDEYKVNKYIWSDAFGIPSVNGDTKVHKYQDPELLYFTILKMFKGCNLVCDPFVGSGTTAEACIRSGRQFIGFEKEKMYFDVAQIRIKKAQEQGKIGTWFGEVT